MLQTGFKDRIIAESPERGVNVTLNTHDSHGCSASVCGNACVLCEDIEHVHTPILTAYITVEYVHLKSLTVFDVRKYTTMCKFLSCAASSLLCLLFLNALITHHEICDSICRHSCLQLCLLALSTKTHDTACCQVLPQ